VQKRAAATLDQAQVGRNFVSPVDGALLDRVRAAVGPFPIWIGSGLSPDNAVSLWPRCDGAIVGTFAKRGGDVRAPVDADRVRALRAACRARG
jgi:predicted TIM-barrel enzyme